MDVSPLCWSDIDAFLRLTGTTLYPWEIALIEMLDGIWARVRFDKTWQFNFDDEEA